jgi:aspartyl-tRNA(Asn)/glutamyl-tRNA(Gln) amidotransferase subunit C
MKISDTNLDKLSQLAKLNFTKNEKESLRQHIKTVLNYMDKLNEIELAHIPPTYSVHSEVQVPREDRVEESLSRKEALRNVPEQRAGFIRVPKVIKNREE